MTTATRTRSNATRSRQLPTCRGKLTSTVDRAGVAVGRLLDAALAAAHRSASPRGLHWPFEGQAAMAIEGVGSLGATGGSDPVPIASITKLMTAHVVLQQHPIVAGEPGPLIRIDARAAAESDSAIESVVAVHEGEVYPLRTLLEFLLIPSGNNIARLLARWCSGTEDEFAARMNEAAAGLGMSRTVFTGSCGMDPANRSTATDLLRLAGAAMHNEVLRAVVATPNVPLPDGTTGHSTNRLLGQDGVVGLKTGTTTPAGGNVLWAATVTVDGHPRLALGAILAQRPGRSPVRARAAVWAHTHRMVKAIHRHASAIR